MQVGIGPRKSSWVYILTPALVRQKSAHGKKRQRQVDGGRVQRIDRVFQLQPQIFSIVKRPGKALGLTTVKCNNMMQILALVEEEIRRQLGREGIKICALAFRKTLESD